MTAIDTSTEAVERLLDGVTPGDWSSYSDDDDPDCPAGFQYFLHSSKYGCVGYWTGHKDNHKDERWYLTEADARFIAAARTLVPALLKERDEARALVSAAISRAEYHADRNTTAADVFRDISDLAKIKGHGHE